MTQSIECSACGATVPYGRLSCAECGEMLASVAGARRGEIARADSRTDDARTDDERAVPGVLHDADAPSATGAGRRPDPAPPPNIVSGASWAADTDGFEALLSETSAPATAAASATGSMTPAVATPGAYVPPTPTGAATLATAAATPGTFPAGPPAPARAWAGYTAADAGVAAGDASAGDEATSDDPLALLSGARAGEFVRWLAIAGSALAVAGMILPWSGVSVIGAGGVGYFDRWGLAGPGHLLVTAFILVVLAVALLRDRVPAWLGLGLPGLMLGGLLVGLTWPYLLGPLGGQLGAVAVALGGILLIAGGVAALVIDRHARGGRLV